MATTTHAKLSFSMRLETTTFTKGAVAIATLDVGVAHAFQLWLRHEDPGAPAATLYELAPGGEQRHDLTALPPAQTWTRVGIDIDLVAGKATVTFDATKVVDATIEKTAADKTTYRVGVVYIYGPADPLDANFDDVVLEY